MLHSTSLPCIINLLLIYLFVMDMAPDDDDWFDRWVDEGVDEGVDERVEGMGVGEGAEAS